MGETPFLAPLRSRLPHCSRTLLPLIERQGKRVCIASLFVKVAIHSFIIIEVAVRKSLTRYCAGEGGGVACWQPSSVLQLQAVRRLHLVGVKDTLKQPSSLSQSTALRWASSLAMSSCQAGRIRRHYQGAGSAGWSAGNCVVESSSRVSSSLSLSSSSSSPFDGTRNGWILLGHSIPR